MAGMTRPPRLYVPNLFILGYMTPMHPSHDRRNKKENHIHDPHRKTSLEHRARFINRILPARCSNFPKIGKMDFVRAIGSCEGGTIGFGNKPEVIYSSNQCADERQVDEADEPGVGAGPVVGEERKYRPGEGEDGDDEEQKNVGGGELVGFEVLVDEPGEHAHYWDQSYDLHEPPKGE